MNYYIPITVATSFSALSCILVIILYHRYPRLQVIDDFKYVYILQIFDLFLSLSVLIPISLIPNNLMCIVQGILLQVFQISSISWTGLISAELYYGLYRNEKKINYPTSTRVFLCLCIGIVAGVVPLAIPGIYVSNNEWCTFSQSINGVIFRYALCFGIIWMVLLWNLFVAIKVAKKCRDIRTETSGKHYITRLKLYPLVIFVCFLPITIIRILEDASIIGEIPDIFQIIAFFLLRLTGFINTVVYWYSDEVKNVICYRDHSLSIASPLE